MKGRLTIAVAVGGQLEDLVRSACAIYGESWRYFAASSAALLCDLTVYACLLQISLMPAVAGPIGYVAGLLLHYRLSAFWVFPDLSGHRRVMPTFAKFAATGVFGTAMTAVIIAMLTATGVAGALAAKGIAVGLTYLAVFLLRRTLVFPSSYRIGHRSPTGHEASAGLGSTQLRSASRPAADRSI